MLLEGRLGWVGRLCNGVVIIFVVFWFYSGLCGSHCCVLMCCRERCRQARRWLPPA